MNATSSAYANMQAHVFRHPGLQEKTELWRSRAQSGADATKQTKN